MSRLPDPLRAHLQAPRNVGEPGGGHDLVGEATNAACRDRLVLYVQAREDRVTAAGFRATGCPAAMGYGSAAAELLTGLAVDADLPAALEGRLLARYGEPQTLHRHAMQLVREALASLTHVA